MHLFETVVTIISFIRRPKKRRLLSIAFSLRDKIGIEIGGPSNMFKLRTALPIYTFAKGVDGVNFSNNTLWEGGISEGHNYKYYKRLIGDQFISEGTNLAMIADSKYDFVLSCHSLEHIANPLKALKEWRRIIKQDALLILILPNKHYTFDIDRPITKLSHLIADFENDTKESDNTHFEEVIALHNLAYEQSVKSKEELINFVQSNEQLRGVHHHVFDFELIAAMLTYAGFKVEYQECLHDLNLVTIGRKA
jgi:SAM-dependent methyltransferase